MADGEGLLPGVPAPPYRRTGRGRQGLRPGDAGRAELRARLPPARPRTGRGGAHRGGGEGGAPGGGAGAEEPCPTALPRADPLRRGQPRRGAQSTHRGGAARPREPVGEGLPRPHHARPRADRERRGAAPAHHALRLRAPRGTSDRPRRGVPVGASRPGAAAGGAAQHRRGRPGRRARGSVAAVGLAAPHHPAGAARTTAMPRRRSPH